jgi:gp16 family phage-associated protein
MLDLPCQRQPADVKAQFRARGMTIRSWAQTNGFSTPLVYAVLGGRVQGIRGQAHEVAVALGLKPLPCEESQECCLTETHDDLVQ